MEELKEFVDIFFTIWNKKLFTIQGIKLSVGSLCLGLFLLLLSAPLSRLVSRWVSRRLLASLKVEKGLLTVYQTFIFYGTLGTFVVISLTIAGIPLTIFTVIGGALAIGVGFGSQNIVNNFISGLILMIEQPVKVGDVVEIDGLSGTIVAIGTRSTKLKTLENKFYIIPNSFFLEKSVLNWTFQNPVVRTEVQVGVAYGSDLEKIKNLMLNLMSEHPLIEKTPHPRIIFDDFGDSALILRMLFWCDLDKVDSLMEIRSDLRFSLDRIFRQHQIEVSYPQRDIHLRNTSPFEVRITS